MKFKTSDQIADIKPYEPGKPLIEVQQKYKISNVIKLASNENPFGFSLGLRPEMSKKTQNSFSFVSVPSSDRRERVVKNTAFERLRQDDDFYWDLVFPKTQGLVEFRYLGVSVQEGIDGFTNDGGSEAFLFFSDQIESGEHVVWNIYNSSHMTLSIGVNEQQRHVDLVCSESRLSPWLGSIFTRLRHIFRGMQKG